MHLAAFFDVTEQTARNWIEGSHAPAGWVVTRAFCAMPAQAAAHLRLVVDNPPPAPGRAREKSARVA